MTLADYILTHTERGECTCGRCQPVPADPGPKTNRHTADLIFFKVCTKNNPTADELRALVTAHQGEYGPCDLFDGKEHSYLEIGGFVGDQGVALMLMGLGSLLGLWQLLTPNTIMPYLPEETKMHMAGVGLITILATK